MIHAPNSLTAALCRLAIAKYHLLRDVNKELRDFRDWIKKTWQPIEWFFVDCYGWCRSIFILCFKGIKLARIFYGYNHYNFASRYAEKRDRKWKSRYDQMGKVQGIFPIEEKLLVCSRLEIRYYQKAGLVSKQASYSKVFKKGNYYKSKNQYKNGKKRKHI